MEFINKIKKKLADARREKDYRKGLLPWQLEGMHRENKEFIPLEDANSILVFTDKPDALKLSQLTELYKIGKDKTMEVLMIHYLPEEQTDIDPKTLPKNINLKTVTDEDITELGEVKGGYLSRLRAKNWDLVVLDLEEMNMPVEYILHLTNAKCIISDTDVNYNYADVQYSTERTEEDNIIELVLRNISK